MLEWSSIDEEALKAIEEEEDKVKTRIIFAREELKVMDDMSRFTMTKIFPSLHDCRCSACIQIIHVSSCCTTLLQ